MNWRRRECVSADVEGALVLLDLETLKYHSLNTTASAVWEILAHPQTTNDIVETLCARYQVSPEQCRLSVETLLSNMSERKLVFEDSDEVPAGA